MATSVLDFLQGHPELGRIPNVEDLTTVLRAEQERRSGHPQKAVALLESRLDGREHYQAHVALMEAYADSANYSAALEQSRWLQQRRGLAYAELDCGNCRQALNVADSAIAARREKELQRQSTDTAAATPKS